MSAAVACLKVMLTLNFSATSRMSYFETGVFAVLCITVCRLLLITSKMLSYCCGALFRLITDAALPWFRIFLKATLVLWKLCLLF